MAISNKSALNYFITATENLADATAGTGHIYKFVDVNGTIAATAKEALGVMTQVASINDRVTYDSVGVSKVTYGGAITAGADITVTTSGYAIAATSGSYVVGKALTAVASGSVGTALLNTVTPAFLMA
jgi:hypothetical protein